jgi:hypothetical protein
MYHPGNRELQDRFQSTALADRLLEKTHRTRFSESDKGFIESLPFFFLATADPEGRPDCSFKGGTPGFVRVIASDLLVFPDYDGNGMFKSLGNIRSNPHVGLLFIAMGDKPKRLRVSGSAELSFDDPLLTQCPVSSARNSAWSSRARSRSRRAMRPATSSFIDAAASRGPSPSWRSRPTRRRSSSSATTSRSRLRCTSRANRAAATAVPTCAAKSVTRRRSDGPSSSPA